MYSFIMDLRSDRLNTGAHTTTTTRLAHVLSHLIASRVVSCVSGRLPPPQRRAGRAPGSACTPATRAPVASTKHSGGGGGGVGGGGGGCGGAWRGAWGGLRAPGRSRHREPHPRAGTAKCSFRSRTAVTLSAPLHSDVIIDVSARATSTRTNGNRVPAQANVHSSTPSAVEAVRAVQLVAVAVWV
jgi:hypothetical protein